MSDSTSSNVNDKIALLERRISREKKSRQMAEQLLAEKSREIYASNQMLKDALLESEQKRDELQFLLITSGSLSLSGNNENLLTNVTELTCTFLHAVWGISAVQIKSNATFDIYTPICDRNKQWTNNTVFIQQVNAQLAQQPASKEWNIIDVNHSAIYPHTLKMMFCSKPIDEGSVLLSAFFLKQEPNSSETLDALTIIQRQVRTFLIARKNGTVISETKDNLNIITQQLSSAKSQLMQSEKMASLGQLAAGIAHEINNPVGYIRSNLEVLSSHVQDINAFMAATKAVIAEQKLITDERFIGLVKEYDMEYIIEDTDDIVTSNIEGVDRISEIVNGLKTFSHQGETNFSALPIGQIVSAALNVVNNEVKYKHDVQHILSEQDIYIFGKLGQLQQVFVNIFVNAAQAMPDGGSIKIEYVLGSKSCQILVTDTGSGMSSTTQKQLFDPFYTTKPVGEGTGLGLSISYSIIESHKGTIEVESTEGVGTTFIITLPLASKVLG